MAVDRQGPKGEVLVSLDPASASDAVSVALRNGGVAVAVCPTVDRRAEPRPVRTFDLAVVNRGLPGDASAEFVVHIEGTREGLAAVVSRGGSEQARVTIGMRTLADLLLVVEACLEGRPPGA